MIRIAVFLEGDTVLVILLPNQCYLAE